MSVNQVVFPIAVMARVLGVSGAGYHAQRRRELSARSQVDARASGADPHDSRRLGRGLRCAAHPCEVGR